MLRIDDVTLPLVYIHWSYICIYYSCINLSQISRKIRFIRLFKIYVKFMFYLVDLHFCITQSRASFKSSNIGIPSLLA